MIKPMSPSPPPPNLSPTHHIHHHNLIYHCHFYNLYPPFHLPPYLHLSQPTNLFFLLMPLFYSPNLSSFLISLASSSSNHTFSPPAKNTSTQPTYQFFIPLHLQSLPKFLHSSLPQPILQTKLVLKPEVVEGKSGSFFFFFFQIDSKTFSLVFDGGRMDSFSI